MHLTNWFAYQCDISTALTSHIGPREVMSHSEPQTTNMHNINIMPMWHFCHCSPSHIYCTMYLFWEYKQWNKQNNDNVDRYLTHTHTYSCTHGQRHTHTHTQAVVSLHFHLFMWVSTPISPLWSAVQTGTHAHSPHRMYVHLSCCYHRVGRSLTFCWCED